MGTSLFSAVRREPNAPAPPMAGGAVQPFSPPPVRPHAVCTRPSRPRSPSPAHPPPLPPPPPPLAATQLPPARTSNHGRERVGGAAPAVWVRGGGEPPIVGRRGARELGGPPPRARGRWVERGRGAGTRPRAGNDVTRLAAGVAACE